MSKKSKNKVLAMILSAFLSFWSFLYTIKWDKKRFIYCLVLFIISLILLNKYLTPLIFTGLWVYATATTIYRTKESYIDYYKLKTPKYNKYVIFKSKNKK